MSVFKKTMLYLGLGPDDEYESAPPPLGMSPEGSIAPPSDLRQMSEGEASAVRPLGPMDSPSDAARVPAGGGSGLVAQPVSTTSPSSSTRINTVRPLPSAPVSAKPTVISPLAFNDAQEVADRFRSGSPVIMNLQSADRDLARRLIDFASGLCYGLSGQMDKVADKVYLVTPNDVEVSAEDRLELRERGLHDA